MVLAEQFAQVVRQLLGLLPVRVNLLIHLLHGGAGVASLRWVRSKVSLPASLISHASASYSICRSMNPPMSQPIYIRMRRMNRANHPELRDHNDGRHPTVFDFIYPITPMLHPTRPAHYHPHEPDIDAADDVTQAHPDALVK